MPHGTLGILTVLTSVTWNDYAESHYIGDINPNVDLGDLAPQYVDGFVHGAWRDVAKYYIQWYKNGAAPPVEVSLSTP